MRTLEEAKKNIAKRLEEAEALKSAWEAVTRNTKKDGSDFSALAKNFSNLTVRDCTYSVRPEKELHVFARTVSGSYVEDDIKNADTFRYTKLENIAEDRVIKQSFLEPYFYLTIDEIFQKINDRILYYTERIETLKNELSEIENSYNLFVCKMEEVRSLLKELSNGGFSDVHSELMEVYRKYPMY